MNIIPVIKIFVDTSVRQPRRERSSGKWAPLIWALCTLCFFANCRSVERIPDPVRRTNTTEETDPEKKTDPDKKDPGKKTVEKEKNPEDVEFGPQDKKKSRRIRTYFSGGELIRETVSLKGFPVVRITIRGGAVLRHNDVYISAPAIIIDGGVLGRCIGGVTIRDPKNGLLIKAKHCNYDRNQQLIELTGNPYMIVRKNKKDKPAIVMATKLVRNMAEGVSRLEGDVRILHHTWNLFADSGAYEDKQDRIVLPNNPVMIGPDQYLSGKELIYEVGFRRISLLNNVTYLFRNQSALSFEAEKKEEGDSISLEEFARRGGRFKTNNEDRFADPELKAEKDETPEIDPVKKLIEAKSAVPGAYAGTNVLMADKLVYTFPREIEPVTELTGNVVLLQKDLTMKTEYMWAQGKDFHTVRADRGVDLVEKKQNVHVVAGVMVYDKKTNRIRLEKDPSMEFFKKDSDEVRATLSGNVIERNLSDNSTVARGEVKIERDNYEATGEIATYDESAGVIILEGEPTMREGNSVIQCEQVMIFPADNRVLLKNRITGFVVEQ